MISRPTSALRYSERFFAAFLSTLLLFVGSAHNLRADEPAADSAAEISNDELIQGNLLAPKAFRVAAAKVLPSVVTIETFGGVSSGAGRIGGIRRQGEGPATGVIVSSDGYVITSTFNFLRQPPIITVVLRDGSRHVAKLLGSDDTRKLCLLKIENAADLPVPEFVPRSDIRVGQWAISLGIGYGDVEPALSAGIVSAASRISGRAIQTDANTSPANYGGPLVDIEGRVIGICVPLSPQSQEASSGVEWYDSGIGFAVPLHGADNLLASLKAGEKIRAGFLGVQAKAAGEDGSGVEIEMVQDDSAAAKAGLEKGDQIISVDGETILDPTHLRIAISKHIAGETVHLVIRRGDEEKEIDATLTAAPQQAARPMIRPGAPESEAPKND